MKERGRKNTEDRIEKTECGRKNTECGRKNTEGRMRKEECGRKKTEGRMQLSCLTLGGAAQNGRTTRGGFATGDNDQTDDKDAGATLF